MSGVHGRRRWLLGSAAAGLVCAASMASLPAVSPARADDASAGRPQAQAGQGGGAESVLELVRESGVTGLSFMAVLGLFSLIGATVALERAVNTRRGKLVPRGFVAELDQVVRRGEARPEPFAALCTRWTAPISTVLAAGLLRCGRPLPEVEKSMEDAAVRELASLRGGIRPLSVIGAIAPLIGLLGTVLGMIVAFRTASQAGLGKGELMAQGIYLALLTTAAGLTIAIPMLLLAALFNARVEKAFREMDELLMRTMPLFARMEGTLPAPDTLAPADGVRPRSPLVPTKG